MTDWHSFIFSLDIYYAAHTFLASVLNVKVYKTWGIAFDTLRARGVYIVEGSTYEKYNVIIIWK